MSLLDLAGPPPPHHNTRPCALGRILTQLTPAERDAVQTALDDPDWPGTKIAEVLTEAGYRVRADTIRRHRRNHCSCEQAEADK